MILSSNKKIISLELMRKYTPDAPYSCINLDLSLTRYTDQTHDSLWCLYLPLPHQDIDHRPWSHKRWTRFPLFYVLCWLSRHNSRSAIWPIDALPIFQIISQARGQPTSTRTMCNPPPHTFPLCKALKPESCFRLDFLWSQMELYWVWK